MARIRTIKPDFWTDETLTECSLNARLLFIGTFNFADDNGNLEASAKQLKMKVFPADNIDCSPLLSELINHGLLIEYSVSGVKYLNIKGFKKHQVINRPSKSNIPDIDMNDDSVSAHASFTDGRERKGKEGNGMELKTITSNSTNLTYDDVPEFLEFWSVYPRRDDKKKSFQAWLKNKPPIDKVLYALSWQADSDQWTKNNGQFIPLGETYINGARWEAERPSERNPF
jgi:hypothetical protein